MPELMPRTIAIIFALALLVMPLAVGAQGEGRVEYRWAHGHQQRIADLVAELVRLRVDIIVAGNTEAAVEAKKATPTIPIVMTMVSYPERRGLIASSARPGGNVTGWWPTRPSFFIAPRWQHSPPGMAYRPCSA